MEWQGRRARSLVHAGARAVAGFHRRAGGCGSGGDARRDQEARRQSRQDKSAAAGRFGDRSFGAGRFVRHCGRVRGQRGAGIRAQPGALSFSALGAGRFRQFPRRAARHRNRAPGESRISGAGGLRVGQGRGVSRHCYRHRFAYDDDQRTGRGRLGRRRNRGGGGDAWAIDADADTRSDRISPRGQPAAGRDRDRPGADGHADAAQEGRGRQVRRVLRAGARVAAGCGSRDARQHVAGVRRDDGIFPG